MKTIKPRKLGLLCKTFAHDDRTYFVVSVIVGFPFDAPRTLLTEAALWQLAAEELAAERGVLDEASSKQRGEVLVTGRCFVPGGAPLPVSFVRVQVGAVDKRLAVFGDRFWRHGAPTAPEPFTEMPVDWAHAFGGEGYPQNPLGKGAAPVQAEGGKVHPLPNVEDPKRLVVSPGDRPVPAGLGALDITWPQRFSLAGTYDDKWLRTRYPGYAADMDAAIFNCAPRDQRIDGYWKGDEAFLVENMHPEKPRLAGALPGAVIRVFLQQHGEAGADLAPLREMTMRADTIRLFPHRERGLVVYRGMVAIREDDAADVARLLVACEDPTDPKPVSHYEAVLAARLDRKHGAMRSLEDEDLMPSAALGWAPRAPKGDVDRLIERRDPLADNLRRRQEAEMARGREELVAMGLDPAAFNLAAPLPENPPPDPDDVDAVIARMDHEQADAQRKAKELEAKRGEMETKARAAFAAQKQDYDELAAKARREAAGPPKFRARDQLAWLKENLAIARSGGAPLVDLEEKAADPAYLVALEAQERDLVDLYRKGAHLQPAADRSEADASDRARAEIEAAHHNGIALAGRDFTGADLSGLSLRGIDLSGAFLESADLTGADLTGANLTGAVLAHATIRGTTLAGAKLDGANLGGATVEGADLSEARMEGTVLARATIRGAKLARAALKRVDFLESRFEGAVDLGGVTLEETLFHAVDLSGARFEGARVKKSVFVECKLAGADFSGADLTRASFVTADADGAVFRGATLDGCQFVHGSSLVEADLSGASAARSLFRDTPMARAKLEGTRADGADFSGCDLTEADLHHLVARGALFIRTDVSRARMTGADLLGAILQKARLHGTDLRGANLFRADLMKVRVDGATRIDDANLKQARAAAAAEKTARTVDGSR